MARNGSLDVSRLLAAFGIVLFHAKAPGGAIGYAGLPFFLMVLLVLALPVASIRDFPTFSHDRCRRLLQPWLIWSAIYGSLKLIEVMLTSKTLRSEFSFTMLLCTPRSRVGIGKCPVALTVTPDNPASANPRLRTGLPCKFHLG